MGRGDDSEVAKDVKPRGYISFKEEELRGAKNSLLAKINPDLSDDARKTAITILYPGWKLNPKNETLSLEQIRFSMEDWLEEAINYCEEAGGSYLMDDSISALFLSEEDFKRFRSLAKDERLIDDQYGSWLEDNFSAEAALEDYFGRKRKEEEDAEWDSALYDIETASWDIDIYNNDLWDYIYKHGFRTFEEWRYVDGKGELPSLDFLREKASLDPEKFLEKVFAQEVKNLDIVA